MKAYLWSVDEPPRPIATKDKWRRFIERRLPTIVIYLMIATLIGIVLFPHVVVTVPAGHVGVLWKRFGGGTVIDPRRLKVEEDPHAHDRDSALLIGAQAHAYPATARPDDGQEVLGG